MQKTLHKKHLEHHKIGPLNFGLIITSDTRTEKTDQTGKLILTLLNRKKHRCFSHQIIKNKINLIRREIKRLSGISDLHLIITSGGTGCGKKDLSIEAAQPLLFKRLDGFGELFRALSFKEIGSSALMSRALLGVSKKGKIICSIPGSPKAVKIALAKLLIPELEHLVWETTR
ncbi:MAG: molybdenum cofactor biosynthesis protein B [Planctomycetota bacterium]